MHEHNESFGLPWWLSGRESACDARDPGLIPGLERSPGEGKGYPHQYSGLENAMDCIVLGVTESDTTEWFSQKYKTFWFLSIILCALLSIYSNPLSIFNSFFFSFYCCFKCSYILWIKVFNQIYDLQINILFYSLGYLLILSSVSESESHSVMSNSLLPHGLYSPWSSPGQNTAVNVFPSSGDLPNLGIKPRSSTLQADSLPAEPQGKP